ncbi:hypothetical protein GHT06_009798 [Daphnia sinensis]|uniref:Uncharacterized protein n=1 Tax=Daphnia sinensis TaxID=1820382 RepID=A0AAD5LPU5_9CRUS|nr:hypothetical protein GHT06_009798 [Daphnia sinensis]
MELLVVIATWLIVTADGYTFQKPVRPADVHYPMASHPRLNGGGYGGHQSLVSSGVNAVAGTRRLYTPRQPVNHAPGARSYFPKHSYVPVPVAPVSSAYRAQHGTTINTKLPHSAKVSSMIKPMTPKQPEKMVVVTSQSYPAVPAAKSHVPVYSPAYSPAAKPVPAEASNRPDTGSLITNLPLQRWIPSYGVSNTKTAAYPPYPTESTPAAGQQQRAKQPTGQVSTMKMKNEKEASNEGSLETPLQTAVLIIRKPSQETKMKSNSQTPDVPAIIPEMQPIVANDYPTPTFSPVTETVLTNPSTLPTPDTPSYQNPSVAVPFTLSPSTSVTNSYQEGVPHLAPEDKDLPLQPDAPAVHQLPEAPTEVNAVHTQQSVNSELNGEYGLPPVYPTTEGTVAMNDGSFSGESQEAIYKTNVNDQQLIPEPAVSYNVPLQSAHTTSTNLQSVEEIAPQIAETKEAVISEPSYAPRDAQQQPAEEHSTFRPTPVSSFDDSAIPKYVLGPYPSLVLPEPPLELASSAYGVAQLGVEEAQPILASQQSVGSYGVPAIRLDNTEHFPLQEQWGYYSAEPFQSTSSDISHSNTLPSSVGGGYQQPLATHPANHPQSSYGFQQPPQHSGYPSSQQSTTGSNNLYQTPHQTVTFEDLNSFQAAANRWIASNGANVVGRQHSAISDKVPVAILKSENVLNEDGSFSYNYETEDGIKVEASGYQKEIGADPEGRGTVAKGSYSYTAPDGVKISVTWVADENGFQPTGDHIPTPPPFSVDVGHLSASEKTGENAVPTGWVRPAFAY